MALDADGIYKKLKTGLTKYEEEIHCPLLLKIMMNKGRFTAFCKEILISDDKFYKWCKDYEFFREVYAVAKIFARELWEEEGEILKSKTNMPGVIDNEFEHWRMVGWSRFGVSKNSRIKLHLDPDANPSQHYAQLLKQASTGDFTAAEIKQLMEAINVGLNTHQVFELQKEIDELKSDLAIMSENTNAHHSGSNKRITEKN